jgi:hypothetical protein
MCRTDFLVCSFLTALMLVAVPGVPKAQERAPPADQVETAQCQIATTGVTLNGIGFVCERGTEGRILIVAAGATPGADLHATLAWLLDARNSQTTARSSITVRHQGPSAAARTVCMAFNLPGSTAREPMTCRELVAAYRS